MDVGVHVHVDGMGRLDAYISSSHLDMLVLLLCLWLHWVLIILLGIHPMAMIMVLMVSLMYMCM